MESFIVALNAVIPFLIYISFGYMIRQTGMVDEPFLNKLNQMVFKAFFPLMMFNNMYQIDPDFVLNLRLLAVAVGSLLALILLMYLIVPRLVKGNPQRGVIIQAIYRSNFVIFAIPLTANVFGDHNTTLASMLVAIVIPIYNVAAVIIFESFRGGKLRPASMIKNVCKNPMIVGAAVGFVFFLLRLSLPDCVEKPIAQFAGATTPLALFVLGGTLRFSRIQGDAKYLIPTLAVKMVLMPAIIIIVSVFMDFTPIERFGLFTMYATPVAAASYPMAQNMDGDGELAGEMVVISTVVSVVTIFLWIFLMKNFGLI